jgi:hypothetical protein
MEYDSTVVSSAAIDDVPMESCAQCHELHVKWIAILTQYRRAFAAREHAVRLREPQRLRATQERLIDVQRLMRVASLIAERHRLTHSSI